MVNRLILPVGYAGGEKESRAAMRLSALRGQGWHVTVYTPGVRNMDERFTEAGIDVRHLPMRGFSDYISIRRMADHLRREPQGACIVAQSFRVAFISLCARRLALRPDIKVSLIYRRTDAPRVTWLARRVYRNLSAIFFTSVYSMSMFALAEKQTGHTLIPPQRKHLILEGVGAAPPPAAEPKGPVMAIYNGDLRHGCGLGRLIDVLPRLRGKRIRLMISGYGRSDYMDRLRRRAMRRDVMDMISWRRDRASLDTLGAQCHFGVFPYKDETAFSDANIELMAAGRPQIVSDGKIAREYLDDDGGGIYVDAADMEGFADAMLRMAAETGLRHKLGREAARRYDTLFSAERLQKPFVENLKYID